MTGRLDEGVAALVDRTRFGRFASVGIIGASIDLSISSTLVLTTTIAPELAKLIGAEVAIIVMFFINDRWTFRAIESRGPWHTLRRLVKSNLVRSGGLAVQVFVVYILTRMPIIVPVGGTDIWPVLTMPIAIGCGLLANYVGETLFTWRVGA